MTYRSFITLPVALTIAASLSACGEGSRPEGFTATLPPPPVAAYGVPQTAACVTHVHFCLNNRRRFNMSRPTCCRIRSC